MGKIKQLMTDFDDRLGKRKKKIDESVQLHKLTEMVRQSDAHVCPSVCQNTRKCTPKPLYNLRAISISRSFMWCRAPSLIAGKLG